MVYWCQRTGLDRISARITSRFLVKELLESLRMGIELEFQNVKALEAMLADCNKLPMQSLESVQRGDFGHGQCSVGNQCIAMSWSPLASRLVGGGGGSAWPDMRAVLDACWRFGCKQLSRTQFWQGRGPTKRRFTRRSSEFLQPRQTWPIDKA